ncbi:MAG: SRPBCC domain-containing protein [Chitinophagaceae bacterium]
MAHSIKHLFHINASKQKVFEAISTIKGLSNWWTNQTTGNGAVGSTIQFRFGEMGGPDMKVTEIKPNEKISWECVASPHGWVGNTFTFSLDENEGKTRVRFSHDGWNEQDDFYAICSFSWGRYMESLRQFCQTGKGEAFGSEGYRK